MVWCTNYLVSWKLSRIPGHMMKNAQKLIREFEEKYGPLQAQGKQVQGLEAEGETSETKEGRNG